MEAKQTQPEGNNIMDAAAVKAEIGSHVTPDGWNIGENLTACDDWDRAEFRIQTIGPEVAINVTISGRKTHHVDFNTSRVRVRIEWLDDDEPSTFSGGWMFIKD